MTVAELVAELLKHDQAAPVWTVTMDQYGYALDSGDVQVSVVGVRPYSGFEPPIGAVQISGATHE